MSEKYLVGKNIDEGELAFVNFESFFEFWTKKRIQKRLVEFITKGT